MNKQVVELRRQFQDGEITNKLLKKLKVENIINDTELSYITMTDEQILSLHDPDNLEAANNGYNKWWYAPNDRRWKIKYKGKTHARRKKADLDKYILEKYYEQNEIANIPTVQEAFDMFMDWRRTVCKHLTEGTHRKSIIDFNRFIAKDEENFKDMKVDVITSDDIRLLIYRTIDRIKDENRQKNEKGQKEIALFSERALNDLLIIIRKIFDYCMYKDLINKNPCDKIRKVEFLSKCENKELSNLNHTDEYQLDENISRVLEKIRLTKKNNPTDLVPFAFELCYDTGMRRSEVTGLKWSDITESDDGVPCFLIQRRIVEERRKNSKNGTRQTHPKGFKVRFVPITPKTKKRLKELEAVKKKYGLESPWIVGIGDNPMNPARVSNFGRDRKHSGKYGCNHLTPTMLRKRNTSLINTEVGMERPKTAALMGNSPEVNGKNYTFYDMGNMSEKAHALEAVQNRPLILESSKGKTREEWLQSWLHS